MLAVGPVIMMKFVAATTKPYGIKTYVSMNPLMIDGTGMCGGCRVKVGDEYLHACVDGPDFDGHLVDFERRHASRRDVPQLRERGARRPRLHQCPKMGTVPFGTFDRAEGGLAWRG